jgi:putative spermidine/putrescine transport system ATP-binding protein
VGEGVGTGRPDTTRSHPQGWVELPCPAALAAHDTVLVRPEDVKVHAGTRPAAASHGAGWGQARVLQRTFLGDRVQLRLVAAGQSDPIVSDQARDCPAAAGDVVHISIDPARLMASASSHNA